MSEETNKAVVRRLVDELWNKGNLAVVDELVAPAFVEHSGPPVLPPGPENLKQQAIIFRSAFSGLYHTSEAMFADGDCVVERWQAGGTHTGDLFGLPPTGRQATTTGIHIFRLRDGKVVEHWGNSDDLGMLQQLGAIPAPG